MIPKIGGGVIDYKFLCFDGEVYCLWVDVDRFENHKRNFYTLDWKRMDVISDHGNFEPDIPKPKNFKEMIKIASQLSKDFPHVRIDLYNINGDIYFGEMTFYPLSGYVEFIPDSFDYILGEKFVLPTSGNK